jgi:hypothetical protein
LFPGPNQKWTMAFDLEMLDAHGGAAAVAWAAQGTKSAQPHRSGVTILAAIAVLAPARVGGRTLPLAVTPGDVGREWGTSWFDGGFA